MAHEKQCQVQSEDNKMDDLVYLLATHISLKLEKLLCLPQKNKLISYYCYMSEWFMVHQTHTEIM